MSSSPEQQTTATTRPDEVALPVAQVISLIQCALLDRGFYTDDVALEKARDMVWPAVAGALAREGRRG